MKHFNRLFLLTLALSAGIGLRYKVQQDSEPVKMIILAIAVLALEEVFYRIDEHIASRSR